MPLTQSFKLPAEKQESPLAKLGLEYAQALGNSDTTRLLPILVEDYHHVFLPGTAFPTLTTRAQFVAHLEAVLPYFGEITGDLKEIVISEDANTIVLQIGVSGTMSDGTPYSSDNLFILHAAQQADGSLKFVSAKEFYNTKSSDELAARLGASKA
ncbi:hypothetical protein EUX98_g6453 [Antrodiella citrinella]|uniref:SnoaL-like domain-containing protein n=1 Tax=Antrodiella citrinella TaxID=2447956 RepID=A0A4S4MNX4_9APHY|nr:hypothetical protein EUX98_g6453 [Antrodiella citrinella]